MARQYSPRSVLRHLPLDLVRRFLERESISTGPDWECLADGDSQSLCQAWMNLPVGPRERVEQMLRHVHDMATHAGVRAVVAEADFRGHDVSAVIDTIDGHHAKALWVLVTFPPVFHTARLLLSAAAPYGRYWNLTQGAPGLAADTSRETLQNLRLSVTNLYREEGRGQTSTIESHERNGCLYLFLYLDDYTQTHVGHNALGALVRRPVRPAFEVVFVYCAATGTLDLYAHGTGAFRAALRDRFYEHVLCADTPPAPPGGRAYRLNGLLDRSFQLVTDPVAGIHWAAVRRLKVSPNRAVARRVTLDADKAAGAGDIYDMLDLHFPPARFPRSELFVFQATFAVRYQCPGDGKERALTFDVSFPDACNLKSMSEDHRAVGERCLSLWGIRDDAPGGVPRPHRVA